jgi:acyl-coenzyme A thioesterase PaaI-like protein
METNEATAEKTKHPHHRDFSSHPWALQILNSPIIQPRTDWARNSRGKSDTLFRRTFANTDTLRAHVPLTDTATGESLTLVSLGSDLNGHEDVLHGGVIATLLDEALGAGIDAPCFTAYLNVAFKQPVKTPGVVLLRSRVMRREGRKVWMDGRLEDGMGTVLASAEGLFVRIVAKI